MMKYSLELQASYVEIIIAALAKQPYEVVQPVIADIIMQVNAKKGSTETNDND